MSQICFTGDALCESFSGHMLKANMCSKCTKDVAKHREEAVKEDDLVKALECTQKGERLPSLVLEGDATYGKLYLGGFKAATNKDFLANENVRGVVNTVGDGLFTLFGRKFQTTYEAAVKTNDIDYLAVEWEDSLQFNIPEDEMISVLKRVHAVRSQGGAVLVHCAQGKSRSTTVVVAYLMALQCITRDQALTYVQTKRKMAEPNDLFMRFLNKFQSSEALTSLSNEFNN